MTSPNRLRARERCTRISDKIGDEARKFADLSTPISDTCHCGKRAVGGARQDPCAGVTASEMRWSVRMSARGTAGPSAPTKRRLEQLVRAWCDLRESAAPGTPAKRTGAGKKTRGSPPLTFSAGQTCDDGEAGILPLSTRFGNDLPASGSRLAGQVEACVGHLVFAGS